MDAKNLPSNATPTTVIAKAYIVWDSTSFCDLGDYVLIQTDEGWRFAYPHLQAQLEKETAGIRSRGYEVVLLQIVPPCPDSPNQLSIDDFITEPYDEEEIL